MYFCIITVRNSSCGKVVFSQASVILSMGGGVSQHALGRGCVSQHALGGRHVADGTHYWNAFLYIFVAAIVTVLIMMAITFLDKIIFGMYLHHVHIVVVLS